MGQEIEEKKDAVVAVKQKRRGRKQSKASNDIKALKLALAKVKENPELTKALEDEIAKLEAANKKKVKLTGAFYQAVGKAFVKITEKAETASRADVKAIIADSYKKIIESL